MSSERVNLASLLASVKGLRPFERRFVFSFAILSLGTGLSTSLLAVYIVRELHAGPVAYGVGVSIAALGGMLTGPIAGRLADRVDGHRVYAALMWTMAIATASLTVANAWAALAMLTVLFSCGRGSAAVMGALVGRQVPPDRRVQYRAAVATASNAAMLTGLGLGTVVLSVDSKPIFQIGFLMEAATLCAAGALVLTLPKQGQQLSSETPDGTVEASNEPQRRRNFAALRDGRFAALTLINGVVMLYSSVPSVALPLWVASHAHSLLWLVSVATAANMAAVLLLQIPMSRGISGLPSAIRASARGAVLAGVGIVMFAIAETAHSSVWTAIVIIVMGLLVGLGEVLYSAGSWEMVYVLAPKDALGEYEGVFNMGFDVSMLLAPALFAYLAGGVHTTTWIVIAAAFITCAALLRPIALRRPAPAAPAEPVRDGAESRG